MKQKVSVIVAALIAVVAVAYSFVTGNVPVKVVKANLLMSGQGVTFVSPSNGVGVVVEAQLDLGKLVTNAPAIPTDCWILWNVKPLSVESLRTR